jgi:hypothetical protein
MEPRGNDPAMTLDVVKLTLANREEESELDRSYSFRTALLPKLGEEFVLL